MVFEEAGAIVQNRLKYDNTYIAGVLFQHQFGLSLDFSLILAMNDEARWMICNKPTKEKQIPDFTDYIYEDTLKMVNPGMVSIRR